jgi:Uma2 family endonuclease
MRAQPTYYAAARARCARARRRNRFTGTRKRDETVKRRLYERAGVSEYWVVDPDIDRIRVYRRQGEGFGRVEELSAEAGDILVTPHLPGLEIPLAHVLRT